MTDTLKEIICLSLTCRFDGLTLLQKFSFQDGRIRYRSRYLSPRLEEWVGKHGFPASKTFAGDPCQSVFGALFTKILEKDDHPSNIGVTISRVQGRLLSKTDANAVIEVDPEDLRPQPPFRYTDINKEFSGYLSAAHGHFDIQRQCYYNYVLDFQATGVYTVFAMPDKDPSYSLARIKADAAYIHSFAATEKFIILIIYPAILSILGMAIHGAILKALKWREDKQAIFYVIDKNKNSNNPVAKFTAPPFFCFHQLNAFEEGEKIHIDLSAYNDTSILESLRLPALRETGLMAGSKNDTAEIRRYTLDLKGTSRQATQTVLCSQHPMYDLPTINTSYSTKPYRFAYTIARSQDSSPGFIDALAKIDIIQGNATLWSEKNCFPGEPIFVADPKHVSKEDAGVLLSVVYSSEHEKSFLLILDAQRMTEICRSWAPLVIPFGFHGLVEKER